MTAIQSPQTSTPDSPTWMTTTPRNFEMEQLQLEEQEKKIEDSLKSFQLQGSDYGRDPGYLRAQVAFEDLKGDMQQLKYDQKWGSGAENIGSSSEYDRKFYLARIKQHEATGMSVRRLARVLDENPNALTRERPQDLVRLFEQRDQGISPQTTCGSRRWGYGCTAQGTLIPATRTDTGAVSFRSTSQAQERLAYSQAVRKYPVLIC